VSELPSATVSSYQQDAADSGYFAPLASARYLQLTTFKSDGIPVSAAVRGVVDGDRAYFRAWSLSGTVKNLRYTDEVQVAPCAALGLRVAPPLDAIARPLDGEEASQVARKLARKYPVRQRFLIPLLQRTLRWQMMHYELLAYEYAAAMADDHGASCVPDRPEDNLRSKEPGAPQITVVRSSAAPTGPASWREAVTRPPAGGSGGG